LGGCSVWLAKMRLKDFQIKMETFYRIGVICFLVIAIANIFTLKILWEEAVFSGKITSIASILFYFALAMFFNYLLNMSRPDVTTQYASDDVEDIIREIKGVTNDKHTRTKKKNEGRKPKTSFSKAGK